MHFLLPDWIRRVADVRRSLRKTPPGKKGWEINHSYLSYPKFHLHDRRFLLAGSKCLSVEKMEKVRALSCWRFRWPLAQFRRWTERKGRRCGSGRTLSPRVCVCAVSALTLFTALAGSIRILSQNISGEIAAWKSKHYLLQYTHGCTYFIPCLISKTEKLPRKKTSFPTFSTQICT